MCSIYQTKTGDKFDNNLHRLVANNCKATACDTSIVYSYFSNFFTDQQEIIGTLIAQNEHIIDKKQAMAQY